MSSQWSHAGVLAMGALRVQISLLVETHEGAAVM